MKYTRQRRARSSMRSRTRRLPRNRIRPNYLLLFCMFTLAICAGVGISYLLTTPKLNVKSVDIKGVRFADAKIVHKAASTSVGRNIILVRTSPIISDVRRLSQIGQVKMGRRFPNRMWLRVWERRPAAVMSTPHGLYLVQNDGFVFHKVSAPPAHVPIILVQCNEKIVPGRFVRSDSAKCSLKILALARRKAIKLGQISVDPKGDICLNMGRDFRVKLGEPDEIERKMSLLQKMLVQRPSILREGGYINLVCPSNPAWKPKAAASPASS